MSRPNSFGYGQTKLYSRTRDRAFKPDLGAIAANWCFGRIENLGQ